MTDTQTGQKYPVQMLSGGKVVIEFSGPMAAAGSSNAGSSLSMPSLPSVELPSVSLPSVSLPRLQAPRIQLPRWDMLRWRLTSSLPRLSAPRISLPSGGLPNAILAHQEAAEVLNGRLALIGLAALVYVSSEEGRTAMQQFDALLTSNATQTSAWGARLTCEYGGHVWSHG